MPDKRIVFINPDTNILNVVSPVYQSIEQGFYADEEELLDTCVERNVPAGVAYRIIEANEIPTHRLFRNAWSDDGNDVVVDMAEARGIHMDDIRIDRDKALLELDITFMRAVEDGDTDEQDAASTAKQALRDIPETFDLSSASTPEQLTVLWPDDLDRSDN